MVLLGLADLVGLALGLAMADGEAMGAIGKEMGVAVGGDF